jgi:hydrogenase maturation protease
MDRAEHPHGSKNLLPSQVLILGIGNPIRGDDGVGLTIIRHLHLLRLENVHLKFSQQLELEQVEEWKEYTRILIVDAQEGGDQVIVESIATSPPNAISIGHDWNPSIMVALMKKLYNTDTQVDVCQIPTRNFEMRESISIWTEKKVEEAMIVILQWIHQAVYNHKETQVGHSTKGRIRGNHPVG